MKKLYFLLAAMFVVAVACHHEPEKPEPTPNPQDGDIIKNAATDYDGNVYDAVRIGQQIWLTENMRTTHTPDGKFLPVSDMQDGKVPSRSYPGGDSSNVEIYGYLYNWPGIMNGELASESNPSGVQGICPQGWHIPSDAEFTQLTDYVSSQSQFWCSDSSTIAKALCATREWGRNDVHCAAGYRISTNNATGFGALPGGSRFFNTYHPIGMLSYFWTTTEYEISQEHRELNAYMRYIYFEDSTVTRLANIKAGIGGLRCLKD